MDTQRRQTLTAIEYKFENDVIPETDTVEYPCVICGREAGPYSGRGRKPRYCPDHKKSTKSVGRKAPKNDALAAQAADALVQVNRMAAFGATVIGYEDTGDALRSAQDEFRNAAHAALVTDEELCRAILRGGALSARLSLLLTYGMMISVVGPVAVHEYRTRRRINAIEYDDETGP